MEAKVDVRKLQILNDRINQTIDALNQVRISVHGLGHTSGQQQIGNPLNFLGQGFGMQQQGLGMQNPYGFGTQGLYPGVGGQVPQQGFPGFGQGLGFGGFQHSPFAPQMNPFTNPFTNPYTNPYTSLGQLGFGQTPFGGTPWTGIGGVAGGLGGGLFHSNQDVLERQLAEVRASDPYRIAQTFPFVIA